MTPQIKLTAARNTGAPVTVHLIDGRQRSGTVHDSGDPRYPLYVRPAGDRARFPTLFHPDDVVEVAPA